MNRRETHHRGRIEGGRSWGRMEMAAAMGNGKKNWQRGAKTEPASSRACNGSWPPPPPRSAPYNGDLRRRFAWEHTLEP